MRAYLLLRTSLVLSAGLAVAQPSSTTGSGSTTSSPNQTTPLGSQTTAPQTTTPSNSNTNTNSRTGATGTDRQNSVNPPNSPSSVTPAYSPNAPGSYNPNNTGVSGGSTAALDLKHGTKVSKLKDAKAKLVGAKLVDTKGEAIGEVASVTTQRSGRATKIVVALDNGSKVTLAAGPLTYLAANNVVVTHQSAKSIQRMHHGH